MRYRRYCLKTNKQNKYAESLVRCFPVPGGTEGQQVSTLPEMPQSHQNPVSVQAFNATILPAELLQ